MTVIDRLALAHRNGGTIRGMTTESSANPFRDDLAAAVERAERLAHDNAVLRARLAVHRFDWIQWMLVGLIVLCGVTVTYILLPVPY